MKHRSLWIPLVLVLSIVPAAAFAEETAATEPLALGSAIPMADARLKNIDGREIAVADLAGKKGTLVVFTCNACPWVKKWENRIAAIGNAAQKRGIGVVAINANDPGVNAGDSYEEMVKRAKKLGLKFPYAMDGTSAVAVAYGATRTPEAFLFDASGKLVYHGTIDDNANDARSVKQAYLRQAVDAVVAGKAVPTAQTKSLGCAIKFRKA